MADLTTVAAVKDFLGLSGSAADALLGTLVTSASATVAQYLGRDVLTHTVTETRSGTGTRAILLGEYPVTAITSVTIDGVAVPARPTPGARGYVFVDGVLSLDGGAGFTPGVANVVVVYVAGYAAVPTDLAQATIDLVARKWKQKDRIGEQSKAGPNGESTSYDLSDLPNDVKRALNPHRRVYPA